MANQEISNAELLAAVVAGTVKQSSIHSLKPIAYRVPVSLLARVDALAQKSGKSRNSMLNSLLEVGLDALFPLLNPADAQDVTQRESVVLAALMAPNSGESFDD